MASEPFRSTRSSLAGNYQRGSSLKGITMIGSSTKQNYLAIYPNSAGNITIRYASNDDDDIQSMDIQVISIEPDDASIIADWLLEVASDMKG